MRSLTVGTSSLFCRRWKIVHPCDLADIFSWKLSHNFDFSLLEVWALFLWSKTELEESSSDYRRFFSSWSGWLHNAVNRGWPMTFETLLVRRSLWLGEPFVLLISVLENVKPYSYELRWKSAEMKRIFLEIIVPIMATSKFAKITDSSWKIYIFLFRFKLRLYHSSLSSLGLFYRRNILQTFLNIQGVALK